MNVLQALVKTVELVLMASIRTLVIAFLAMLVPIVKQILMIVLLVLVKMEELVLMASILTLVIAFLATQEKIAKQVIFAYIHVIQFELSAQP